jgi:serine/threonine-protein kinase
MSWDRLESLLDEFLEMPEEARPEFLEGLDRSRPDEARALRDALGLEGDEPDLDCIGSLLDAVGSAATTVPEEQSIALPEDIGPWRPTELIASGGMGDVFKAQRIDGEYEATAALKRLRIHVTSTSAHDRFRLERQVLSDLRHPHIANLLDGGVDTHGVPFFVMEFVDGLPITTHCDLAELSIRDRLKVFGQVTEAVAAAHSQLVVHRDLKPPNILVASNGNVKLVDFGIAKLLDDSTDVTVTANHERLLTPRYAAPEQLLGKEITTATDVYGLGVVLYELLSGVRSLTDDELQRTLLVGAEVPDPPQMSAAIAGLDPTEAANVARQRGTTPRGHLRELRGDLDAIVAKALRPDPADRYPTVAALAEDLRRARNSEPVEAHLGSWPYRLRKLWARHRVPVTALVLILLSLSVGLWIALAQARAAHTAQRQAAAINRFLTEELLGSADPRMARGREVTVREILDRTSQGLGSVVGSEPKVEASIRKTLGEVWIRLGSYGQARAELEAAKELASGDPVTTARVLTASAELLFAEGRYSEARTETEKAAAMLSRTTGPSSLDTIQAMVLRGRVIDGDADPIEAERVLRQAADLLDRYHPDEGAARAEARIELATVLRNQGRRIEGLDFLSDALDLQRQSLGDNHPDVARTLEDRAEMLSFLSWHDEAEQAAREALEIVRTAYGPAHWRFARGAYVLGKVLAFANRPEDAAALAESTLEVASPVLGDDHQEIVRLRNIMAVMSRRLGDDAAAIRHYRAALEGAERGLGPDDDICLMIRSNLSNHLARMGRDHDSLELALEIRKYGIEASRSDHPDPMYLAKTSYFLSTASLEEARDPVAAMKLAQRAVEASNGRWYYPWVALSHAHSFRREVDEAIVALRRAVLLPDGLHYPALERKLVDLLTEQGDLQAAEEFLREHLSRRRSVRANDDPLLGHTQALLGRVLLAQGRYEESERELRGALDQYDLGLEDEHEWWIPALSDLGAILAVRGSRDEAEEALARAYHLATTVDGRYTAVELELINTRLDELERITTAMPPGADAATPAP